MAHEEQFSTNGGPATLKVVGNEVQWSINTGGVETTGAVPIENGEREAALYKARRAVQAFVQDGPEAARLLGSTVVVPAPAEPVTEETKPTE